MNDSRRWSAGKLGVINVIETAKTHLWECCVEIGANYNVRKGKRK